MTLSSSKSLRQDHYNVLVFPCGSEIGLELHNALRWSKDVTLFGGSSAETDHGYFVYKNYISGVPYVNDPAFISSLRDITVKHDIDYIFPSHDDVVLELARSQEKLSCKVIGSPLTTCEICRSKSRTYQFLKTHDIVIPERLDPNKDNEFLFPVFLKPDVGQGSKGTHIAHSSEELEFYLRRDPTLLVLEYLPGAEYTIDCVTDRYGELLFVGARQRRRIQNGISVNTSPVEDPRFVELAKQINQILTLRGAWFFQVKENAVNELAVMEIAPRVAGSMGMYRNLGVNFPLLSLYVAAGKDLSLNVNSYAIEMDRALFSRFRTQLSFKHVYVDFDDTIIIKEQVNTLLLSFLYQCLNKGVQLHLLTRCAEDIHEKLVQYRLNTLFDTVDHLHDRSLKKSAYIREEDAIFIDDSYQERNEVQSSLNIPVFDVSAIESLLDWRG